MRHGPWHSTWRGRLSISIAPCMLPGMSAWPCTSCGRASQGGIACMHFSISWVMSGIVGPHVCPKPLRWGGGHSGHTCQVCVMLVTNARLRGNEVLMWWVQGENIQVTRMHAGSAKSSKEYPVPTAVHRLFSECLKNYFV